jgi:hypothetical protein
MSRQITAPYSPTSWRKRSPKFVCKMPNNT